MQKQGLIFFIPYQMILLQVGKIERGERKGERPPPCMAKEDAAAAAGGSARTAAGQRRTTATWSSGEGRTMAARGRRASGGWRPFRTAVVAWVRRTTHGGVEDMASAAEDRLQRRRTACNGGGVACSGGGSPSHRIRKRNNGIRPLREATVAGRWVATATQKGREDGSAPFFPFSVYFIPFFILNLCIGLYYGTLFYHLDLN